MYHRKTLKTNYGKFYRNLSSKNNSYMLKLKTFKLRRTICPPFFIASCMIFSSDYIYKFLINIFRFSCHLFFLLSFSPILHLTDFPFLFPPFLSNIKFLAGVQTYRAKPSAVKAAAAVDCDMIICPENTIRIGIDINRPCRKMTCH